MYIRVSDYKPIPKKNHNSRRLMNWGFGFLAPKPSTLLRPLCIGTKTKVHFIIIIIIIIKEMYNP